MEDQDKRVEGVEEALKEQGIEVESNTEEKGIELSDSSGTVSIEKKNTSDEKVLSETEEEAKSKGWDPDGPKSADEYLRAEPLYEEIKARGKDIKELKDTISHLKGLMDKQQQAAYQQAISDLQAARNEAIELGDVEEVNRIEDQAKRLQQDVQPPQVSEKVQSFVNRNQGWLYNQNEIANEIKMVAEAKYQVLKQQGKSDEEIIDIVEPFLQKVYPDVVAGGASKEASTPKVSPVDSPSLGASAKHASRKKFTFSDLNDQQKEACRYFDKAGIMKPEDYIKELIKVGDLK